MENASYAAPESAAVTADRELEGRRVVVGLGLALIAATALFGAVLGYALPARTGLEEITVLETAVAVSPLSLAVYGGATVAVALATLLLVVRALSRFDEDAV